MAATTIDDLQIKIEADAKTASDKLDALAQSMVKLASSLSINVGKMSGVAIGLNSITKASQNLNSRNITTMATAMGKIAGVDSAQISRVAGSMTQLKNSVSGGFSTDMTGIVNVANSLSKLGGKNATQGAQNLVLIKDQLAQFVQGMNSVGTFTFDPTGLTNTIKAIAKLGGKTATQATANLPSISAQLQNFVRQMNQIGSMSFDNKNLTDLVTSIGRLGSVASGRAVNNIPLLANNLKYLFDTLSKAPNISQNIIQMTTALANLARTGASSGTAARSLGTSLFSFSKSAGNARKSAFSLAGAIGKFYATYWMVIRGLGLFRNAIDISSDLTEVENVVRTTFGDMEYKVNDFVQNSIQQFGMSELSVKQYASTFQAMGTAMDIGSKQIEKANSFLSGATDGYVGLSDSLSDVSLNLTKLTADIASFYDKDQADVAKDLQSIFSGMIVPLRKYGLDLTQATLKEWAMKNGMDADIKSMTQAEKAMLRYQYVLANTTAAQRDFARTADTWHNTVVRLKQSFQQLGGIIGGALINAFKPFLRTLNFVMQKVISFATTVTNALGAIFGWKFEVSGGGVADDWSDAASSADDLADSTGKAADNTKKMKNNLLAIDELNVLNPDDSDAGSGGSGSGAGGAGGGAGSGGLVKTDTIFKDFQSNIKDLYQLGRYISEELSRAMESIDWDSIYEKARNFGKGLADFLNGLINPRLFGNVGKTIAGALNTAMEFLNSFGTEFDWTNFGESIAAGINKFLSNFNFKLLATTLNTWVKGFEKAFIAAIKKFKWSNLVNAFTDFFGNLRLDTALLLLIPASGKVTKAFKDLNNAAKLVSSGIGAFTGDADSISYLATKSASLASAVDVAGDSFQRLMFGIHYGDWAGGLNSAIANIRDNLTGLQKGIIGVVSVVAEFTLIRTAFYDLQSGSENLVSSIAKITVGAGAASAALYVAFGPAGLAVAAFTALAAAISGTSRAFSEQEDMTLYGEKLSDITERLRGTAQATVERMQASKEYVDEVGTAEATMAQDLANQYFDLAEKENLTNEEKEKMKSLASSLVDTLPGLSQYYNEETGLLNTTRESVENLIQSKLEDIRLSAIQDELKSAYSEQITAYKTMKEALDNANASKEKMNELQENFNLILEKQDLKAQYDQLSEKIQNSTGDTTLLLDEQEKLWAELTDNGENKNFNNFDYLNQKLGEATEDINGFKGKYEETMQTLADAKGAYDMVGNTISELTSMMTDGMVEAADNSISGYSNTLSTSTEAQEAASQMAQNVLDSFAAAQDSHSPSKKFAALAGDSVDGYVLGTQENASKMEDAGRTLAENAIQSFNDGIRNNSQSTIDAMNEWISGITSALSPEIWTPAFTGMLTGFQTKWSELTTWWSGTAMPSFFSANVAPWFTDAFWNAKTNGMKLGLQQKWNEFVTWWKSSINLWFTVNVMPWFTVARWTEQGEHFRKALKDKWDEFSDQWHKDLTTWWNTDVTVWFTVAKWNAFGTNMKNGLYEGFKGIVQMVGNVMNGMIDVFNAGLSKIQKSMNSLISDFNKNAAVMGVSSLHKVHFDSISHVTIPAYEVGGFPEDGLFFANHNEMVGQFSNGRTAVANNEQIVAGIREGVKAAVTEALAPYLSDIADTNREIAEKDASINVDGRELVNAINSRISRNGFSFT